MRTPSLVITLCLLCGCSARAMYENVQRDHERDCLGLSPAEYERCMEGLDAPFEEYQRERQLAMEREPPR